MAVGSCCLSSEIYFGWLTLDGAFRAHGWLCSEDSVKILFTGPCNEFDKPSSNIRKQIQVFKVSFLTQIKVLRSDASNGNQSCDSSDPAYHTVVLVYSIFFVVVFGSCEDGPTVNATRETRAQLFLFFTPQSWSSTPPSKAQEWGKRQTIHGRRHCKEIR